MLESQQVQGLQKEIEQLKNKLAKRAGEYNYYNCCPSLILVCACMYVLHKICLDQCMYTGGSRGDSYGSYACEPLRIFCLVTLIFS